LREEYISEVYYDKKANHFYELKLRKMIDEEYTTTFLELLRYMPYIKDENTKI